MSTRTASPSRPRRPATGSVSCSTPLDWHRGQRQPDEGVARSGEPRRTITTVRRPSRWSRDRAAPPNRRSWSEPRRADIEYFGRDMETRGRARSTIARRLFTVAGFYRYAVEEELLEHSPAVHVRRRRLDYESHAIGLDRNEVGSLLVAAGLGAANEHALISLLAINGLRISEALGAAAHQLVRQCPANTEQSRCGRQVKHRRQVRCRHRAHPFTPHKFVEDGDRRHALSDRYRRILMANGWQMIKDPSVGALGPLYLLPCVVAGAGF
jgi:integrase